MALPQKRVIDDATADANADSSEQQTPPETPSVRKRKRTSLPVSSLRRIAEVASHFGLSYLPFGESHVLSLTQPTRCSVPMRLPCLMRAIAAHVRNFDRTSEAICRGTVDMVLNECLIILKNLDGHCAEHSDGQSPIAGSGAPFAQEVIVNGEVDLYYHDPMKVTTYVGRVDYSVGLVAKAAHLATVRPTQLTPTFSYPYSSCILLAVAKRSEDVDGVMAQLCLYLAIVRANRVESRKTKNKHISADVYGLATDGLKYNFMAIDDAGNVRVSQRLWLTDEASAREIVGAIIGILEGELHRREQTLLRSRQNSRGASAAASEHADAGLEVAQVAQLADGNAMVDENVLEVRNLTYTGSGRNDDHEDLEEASPLEGESEDE